MNVPIEVRADEQLPRSKQLMPMRPATRADRFVRLVARLDRHVRNKPFFLPLGEIFVHDGFDFAFASEVILGNASEERVMAIACSPWLCSCYPPWPWSSSRPIEALSRWPVFTCRWRDALMGRTQRNQWLAEFER